MVGIGVRGYCLLVKSNMVELDESVFFKEVWEEWCYLKRFVVFFSEFRYNRGSIYLKSCCLR